ncbi:hypothetical protein GGF42_003440, partial [Coemansia sp. RSA 2424]
MTLPSLFQTLPLLLVEKIIKYLLECPRDSADYIDEHNKRKAALTPLLSISQLWCEAVLVSFCDKCSVNFNATSGKFEVKYYAWPTGFSYPRFPRNSVVKRVSVWAPRWLDLCRGRYSETSTKAWGTSVLFPSATTLEFHLVKSPWRAPKSRSDKRRTSPEPFYAHPAEVAKVANFAHSLLRLTPAATSVVACFVGADPVESGYMQLCTTLVSELCQGRVKSLEASPMDGNWAILNSLPIAGLTSLTQKANMASAPFAELAYRNAGTLKELRFRTSTEADWQALIYGGTETSAVYASLSLLTLGFGNINSGEVWAKIEGVAPFPYLSTLEISDDYPFDDDLPFRGNGATLQSLSISFRAFTGNILGRHNVLSRSGVTRMNSVRIFSPKNSRGRSERWLNDGRIASQMHRIAEVATKLFIVATSDPDILKAICTTPRTAILQYLECDGWWFDLEKIVEIVSALPSLVSLTCK